METKGTKYNDPTELSETESEVNEREEAAAVAELRKQFPDQWTTELTAEEQAASVRIAKECAERMRRTTDVCLLSDYSSRLPNNGDQAPLDTKTKQDFMRYWKSMYNNVKTFIDGHTQRQQRRYAWCGAGYDRTSLESDEYETIDSYWNQQLTELAHLYQIRLMRHQKS